MMLSIRRAHIAIFAVGLLACDGQVSAQKPAGKVSQAAVREFNATAALQNSGFYARAAVKWTAFIKKYPTDTRLGRVYYYLGVCQLRTNKYPEAEAAFQVVLTKYPKFASLDSAQYNLSRVHYQVALASKKPADFKKAAAAFGVTVSKYPQSKHADKALYFQGDALFSASDLPGATAAYKKLIATYAKTPLLPDALYALGTIQQESGADTDAVATFQAFVANPALAKHELVNEINLRLGMSLFNMKKYPDAEKLFAAVVAVPEFSHADFALLRYGQCQLEAGKPDVAAAKFSELTTKFPKSAYLSAAQLSAGKCYYLTEKLPQAVTALTPLAAAKLPESAEAAYWLGRTLLKQQKPQDAFTRLDAAAKAFTEGEFVPYLQMARTDALYDLPMRRKETVALYQAFVKQFPDHALTPQAVYMSALAALGQENYAGARTGAEAFLANAKYAEHELVPAVLYIAAEGYLLPVSAKQEGGDLVKAEARYRTLVTKHANHSRVLRAHLRIGWCLYQGKKYDDSLKYLTDILAALKVPAMVAEAQLLIGRNHSSVEREKEALAAYDAAIKAKPDWTRVDELLIASAQSLRALGNAAEALKRLTQLIASFPKSTYRDQAIYQMGEIALSEKQYDPAIARYKQLLQQFPKSEFVAPAHYGLGASYFAKEDYANAFTSLTALAATKPEAELAARGLYLHGLVQQRQKKFQPALADLQAFLATKPTGEEAFDARYASALCQIGLKQFAPAITGLSALINEKPDFAHADKIYYEIAHAQLALDKPAEALAAFGTIAEKLPDSPLAAESFFHIGRFHEQAADALKDEAAQREKVTLAATNYAAGLAKAKAPKLREKLQYKSGDMQFRLKKYDLATKTLTALVTDNPQGELLGPGKFLLAESLFRQGAFTKALPFFVQVATAKVEKYHAQSLYRAGTCAGNLKQWPVSQAHYQALITAFPKFEQISEARYGLGLAMQNQKQLPQARAVYEQVTAETETETAAKARFMIGEIAFAEKKYEDAIEQFLAVAVGYPYKEWQALAQFETGRCFMELGKKERAIAALEIVVNKYADHPKVADATKLIAELEK